MAKPKPLPQPSERRRGRRRSPMSTTVRHKRGALAELRETLSPDNYARLERAVNRQRRGMPPEHPQRSQLEERCKAASVKAAELYRASVVELQRAQALAIQLDELDAMRASQGKAVVELEEQAQGVLNALDGELQARAEEAQDRKPEAARPSLGDAGVEAALTEPGRCVTTTPDRWCDACGKARATPMCSVCGAPTHPIQPR